MMAVDIRASDMAGTIEKVVSVLDNTTKKGDATDAFRMLHAIHTFLSNLAPTPREAEVLASRLLPALVAAIDGHAFYQPCPADDADSEDTGAEEVHKQFIHSLIVTDAAAAVINTILRTPLSDSLHALALGQAVAAAQPDASNDWNPAVGVLLGRSVPQPARYRHWIRAVARIMITPGDVAVLRSSSYPGSLIRGHEGKLLFWDPQHLPSTPGAATMLAVGSIRLLQAATGRSCLAGELLPWDFCWGDDHGAATKLVLLLSKDGPMLDLPDGALSYVLFSQLLESRGRICECLLNSPAALKALTQPLMHLAADPISWKQGPYAYHVQVLGYLCQWAASTVGLGGVQLLAHTFMGPASGALSSLLELPPAERRGATCLVRSCLLLLTHLACTSFGQRTIKVQELMSRWLAAAPRWRQQLPVLQHLALLARAQLVDYQQELYFSPLFENERWQFRLVDASTGAAPDQAAGTSVQVLDCVTAILRGPADTATKAMLVDVLSRVAKARGMPYFPAVDTLLDTASPSHASRIGDVLDSNAALSELDMYLEAAGVSWEGCQQQALALILRCLQQKTVTVQLSGPGSGGEWAEDVKQILLACFQLPSAGAFIRKEDPVSRLQLLRNLEVFLKADILPLTLDDKHILIHCCGTMLHHISTAEEASILLHLLYHMLVCGECSNATLTHLSCVLADPAALDAVLTFVEGRLDSFHAAAVRSGREGNSSSSSSSSSSSWAGDRLPVGATSRQEDTPDAEDIRQLVLPLNAVFVAALNWVLQVEVDRYHAAATRLLLSDGLWDKVQQLLDSEVLLQPESELRSVWMFLARFRIKGHQGPFNALAAEICHMLGERRASRMIEAVVTGPVDSAADWQRMMRAFGSSTATAIFGVAKLRELQWKAILGEA